MMMPNDINLYPIIPEILLTFLAIGVLMIDLLVKKSAKSILAIISVAGLICIMIVTPFTMDSTPVLNGMISSGGFSTFFDILFLLSAVVAIIVSTKYLDKMNMQKGEYYALILFATLGMMIMAGALDFVAMYVGLELMALAIYILVAFRRNNQLSIEGALKYFILGAFSSAILLYGISFIYGYTGNTNYTVIGNLLMGASSQPIALAGVLLIIVGFSFKVSMFPFHSWTPDAYEGAATPVTAFMSVAPKAAAFAIFVKVFVVSFGDTQPMWSQIIWILSLLTMLFGSLLAVVQKNIIRMLAYSSIAHTGIIIIGLMTYSAASLADVLYYMMVYTFMNLGSFAVIVFCIDKNRKGEFIEDYKGLGASNPWMAFLLALFLLSLAGIPPTGGFLAKFYIFAEAINEGYYVLSAIGIATTAITLFVYAKVIFYMFLAEKGAEQTVEVDIPGGVVLGLMGLATVILGLYPAPFMKFALTSIEVFF